MGKWLSWEFVSINRSKKLPGWIRMKAVAEKSALILSIKQIMGGRRIRCPPYFF